MLPFPGSPASSWAVYRSRLESIFDGADPRVCAAFWLFGLINNLLFVIILSAALDLVGPSIPKAVVLLADVLPSFLTKLVAPFFIHKISYSVRVVVFVIISTCGMLLIALAPAQRDARSIGFTMAGIILASLSSGGGELSFLGLTHYYGHFSLALWGSGTGGAGLVGAGAYVLATTTFGLSVRASLLTFSFLPLAMLATFFLLLPKGPLTGSSIDRSEYESMATDDSVVGTPGTDFEFRTRNVDYGGEEQSEFPLYSNYSSRNASSANLSKSTVRRAWHSFQLNIGRSRALFLPYMLPLLLVYIAEYTINQGVAPTLLFPLAASPFKHFRDFYPTYNAIYQTGAFLSRSSTPFFRIHNLYMPSWLQVLNLVVLTLHAMFDFIPSVYIMFAIIFWEGLLGGIVYVSTFAEITDNVPKVDREFSLSATSVSDSGGVCVAGFIAMALELFLCGWQVRHGRDYCRSDDG